VRKFQKNIFVGTLSFNSAWPIIKNLTRSPIEGANQYRPAEVVNYNGKAGKSRGNFCDLIKLKMSHPDIEAMPACSEVCYSQRDCWINVHRQKFLFATKTILQPPDLIPLVIAW
jgi:hypothetical protein